MIKCLIKLWTVTFPLKGSTLRLLCGISELPASWLLLCGAAGKKNKDDLNTSTVTSTVRHLLAASEVSGIHCVESTNVLDKGMVHIPGGWSKIPSHCQNSARFKTYKLFIPGTFHLIFSGCSWPQVIEITESKTTESDTVDKGDYCTYKNHVKKSSVSSDRCGSAGHHAAKGRVSCLILVRALDWVEGSVCAQTCTVYVSLSQWVSPPLPFPSPLSESK